jgi:hypothetical protein
VGGTLAAGIFHDLRARLAAISRDLGVPGYGDRPVRLGYAYAAWRLDRAAPFIAIGLAGKLLGPAGWVQAVTATEWPIRTITLIIFSDVIWWMPFILFMLEGRRAGARLRASAPYVCASLNLAAVIAMAAALRSGTEIVPVVSDRIAYISQHPAAWRAG